LKWHGEIIYQLFNGDVSMVLLLGGLGLILWALLGITLRTEEFATYICSLPIGNKTFWIINYISVGSSMWWLAAKKLPALPSLLIGTWICTIWSWVALARITSEDIFQTNSATPVFYILIGLLIIQRSGKY
jgi:hypothetical protein